MPTLVTVVERSSSIEQELRDDTMVEQIKETKRGGIEEIEEDERLRMMLLRERERERERRCYVIWEK